MNVNQITQRVIGAAIEVHRVLGPGLLEEAYQKALERELQLQQIPFESQKQLGVTYKGVISGQVCLRRLIKKLLRENCSCSRYHLSLKSSWE